MCSKCTHRYPKPGTCFALLSYVGGYRAISPARYKRFWHMDIRRSSYWTPLESEHRGILTPLLPLLHLHSNIFIFCVWKRVILDTRHVCELFGLMSWRGAVSYAQTSLLSIRGLSFHSLLFLLHTSSSLGRHQIRQPRTHDLRLLGFSEKHISTSMVAESVSTLGSWLPFLLIVLLLS